MIGIKKLNYIDNLNILYIYTHIQDIVSQVKLILSYHFFGMRKTRRR